MMIYLMVDHGGHDCARPHAVAVMMTEASPEGLLHSPVSSNADKANIAQLAALFSREGNFDERCHQSSSWRLSVSVGVDEEVKKEGGVRSRCECLSRTPNTERRAEIEPQRCRKVAGHNERYFLLRHAINDTGYLVQYLLRQRCI